MPQKHPAATVQRCAPSGTAPGADEEDSGATESRVDWVKGRASRAMKDGKPDMAGSGRVERFEEQKSSGGGVAGCKFCSGVNAGARAAWRLKLLIYRNRP